jgi:thiosulfate/3-mercaptopyruvate sulfurtransferase
MAEFDTTNWSYDDFLAFVLLYAANVNIDLASREKQLIIDKVGREKYAKASKCFASCNDYERLQTIISMKDRFYPTEQEKEKVLRNIKELFLADGKFDHLEKSLLLSLKRFM